MRFFVVPKRPIRITQKLRVNQSRISLSGETSMGKQMRRWLGNEVDDFIWHLR